jgi:hypothetical protein
MEGNFSHLSAFWKGLIWNAMHQRSGSKISILNSKSK